MKFEDKHTFKAPADKLMKMFSDKAYFEQKYKKLGFTNIEVLEHSSNGDNFSITVRYNAKNDAPMPDFAKKFLPTESQVVQTDSWNTKSKTGSLSIEIKGVPVKINADMKVSDAGAGCANNLSWNLKCGIPLVGGKLEKVIAEDIQAKSAADIKASTELLAAY